MGGEWKVNGSTLTRHHHHRHHHHHHHPPSIDNVVKLSVSLGANMAALLTGTATGGDNATVQQAAARKGRKAAFVGAVHDQVIEDLTSNLTAAPGAVLKVASRRRTLPPLQALVTRLAP